MMVKCCKGYSFLLITQTHAQTHAQGVHKGYKFGGLKKTRRTMVLAVSRSISYQIFDGRREVSA